MGEILIIQYLKELITLTMWMMYGNDEIMSQWFKKLGMSQDLNPLNIIINYDYIDIYLLEYFANILLLLLRNILWEFSPIIILILSGNFSGNILRTLY